VSERSVGLVGFGRWGQLVFRDLTALGVSVAVAVPSEENRRRAKDAGATAAVSRVEDLPEVDGAVVVTPTATHAEVVERLLDRIGGPIFVEKPLTCDVEDARRIARRAPDRVFVMDKWRYHAGIEALRDLAHRGRFRNVTGLRSTRTQWGNQHGDVDGTWILMPHDLAVTREILGQIPAPVMAFGQADGLEVDLVAVLGREPWARIEISTRFPFHRREVIVAFEGGAAWLGDSYDDRILVQPIAGEVEEISISTEMPLLRELRAFVEHIGGGPPPKSNAVEGVEVVEIIAACRSMAGIDPS
jgi:predicted dehydrogenase